MSKFFGTDGIRGQVGIEPITPATIVHLGWALGTVIKKHFGAGPVLIGKDTRVSGYLLESAMEAGLASAGMDRKTIRSFAYTGYCLLNSNCTSQGRSGDLCVSQSLSRQWH